MNSNQTNTSGQRSTQFGRVPTAMVRRLVREHNGDAGALAVYLAVAAFDRRDWTSNIGQAAIAEMTGLHLSTVMRAVGRLVAGLATDLLARMGFDNILGKLGLSRADPSALEESRRPSSVAGKLVMIFVMLFTMQHCMRMASSIWDKAFLLASSMESCLSKA